MEFVFGILVLLLDIWAIVGTLESSESGGKKLAWVVGIVIFPLIGFVVWLLAGPRGRRAFI